MDTVDDLCVTKSTPVPSSVTGWSLSCRSGPYSVSPRAAPHPLTSPRDWVRTFSGARPRVVYLSVSDSGVTDTSVGAVCPWTRVTLVSSSSLPSWRGGCPLIFSDGRTHRGRT